MINAVFTPYGQSLGRSIREAERLAESCPHDFSLHSRDTVSVTLSRLKKKGMVVNRGPKKKTIWSITTRGKSHFKDRLVGGDLPPSDGKIRLVVYDIPEGMASMRVWLRKRLLACDYSYLQKSVWLGNRPLPKELLDELKERKILSFIHVVGLEKSLGELINS